MIINDKYKYDSSTYYENNEYHIKINNDELMIRFAETNDIYDIIRINLSLNFTNLEFNKDIFVVNGLKVAFEKMISGILKNISNHFSQKIKIITICGYSLGGAFAHYLFFYLLYNCDMKVKHQKLQITINDNLIEINNLWCLTYNSAPLFGSTNKHY